MKQLSTKKTFGGNLRRFMLAQGVNQTELAQVTGMERSELNRTINNKRPPKPEEISWLAQALKVSVGELLDGVELPQSPQVRQEIERAKEDATRVLKAESEKNEALARVKVLEDLLKEERENVKQLQQTVSDMRTDHKQQLLDQEKIFSQQEAELNQSISKLRSELKEKKATEQELRNQVSTLQKQLSAEKSNTTGAMILSGLIGAALNSK